MAAGKGVVVELDFAALDGAELLYGTAERFLKELDNLPFSPLAEAQHFAGKPYAEAFQAYLGRHKSKKTAGKAAKDFPLLFEGVLEREVPKALTVGFGNFVKALVGKGLKVVISSRIGPEVLQSSFAALTKDGVVFYRDDSAAYGCTSSETWARIARVNGLDRFSTVAVTGSGLGVRSALRVGMRPMAVLWDHVAYQDYSGVAETVADLNAAAAKAAFRLLKVV